MTNRCIIAVGSDWHSGHELGLLNPDTELVVYNDGGKPYKKSVSLNHGQEFLWDVHLYALSEIKKLAGRSPIFFAFGADGMQGVKYTEDGQIETRFHNQLAMAAMNFEPWLKEKAVKGMRMVSSTPSHSFNHSGDILLADMLKATSPTKDIAFVPHGLLTINGVDIDVAHHGPHRGMRKWLEGNMFRFYMRDIMMGDIYANQKFPDAILRGHVHTPRLEVLHEWIEGQIQTMWGAIIPPMQLLTDFGRQVTQSVRGVTVGLTAIEIEDSKIIGFHFFTRTRALPAKEVINI